MNGSKTIKEPDGDDLVESYLQYQLMKQTRSYVERGRPLENSSDEHLSDIWVAAFERWFKKSTPENRLALDDATAELSLRGLDLPSERVQSSIDLLNEALRWLGSDFRSDQLNRRIDEFLAERS